MLKTRVLTALLLLAGFLAALFLLPFYGWLFFSSLVAALGGWEWGSLIRLRRRGRLIYSLISMSLSVALGWLVFNSNTGMVRQEQLLIALFALAGLFWLLIVPLWLLAKWNMKKLLPGLLTGWVVLLPACLALMQLRAVHPLLLLACMAAVWVADIAAYFCGRAIGRHKLAPTISPGKTWEGAIGAFIGVTLYGMIIAWAAELFFNKSISNYVLAGILLILTAVSILGDLFESLIKRQAGVKDSGAILPGHGGLLDRIDSLTSTLPLAGLALLAWDGWVS
jgi:phosphatidate cytidylyltransferase